MSSNNLIISTLNVQNLLIPKLSQDQDLEDNVVYAMWNSRLEVATGATLDMLGEIAGQARGYDSLGVPQSDDDYRAFIKIRRIANRASGTISDMYNILQIVEGDSPSTLVVLVTDTGNASCSVSTNADRDFSVADLQMIRRMVGAGIKVNVLHVASGATPFVFKYAGAADPTYGGGFSSSSEYVPTAGKLSKVL